MTQLPWRPALSDRRRPAGGLELAPDISRIQGAARPRGEDEVMIAPLRTCGEPFPDLPVLMSPERVHRHLGEAQRPARLLSLGVSVRPHGAPHCRACRDGRLGSRVAEVDMLPAQCPRLLSTD